MIDLELTGVEVVGSDLDNTWYVQSPEVDEVIQGFIHEQCAEILGIPVDEARVRFDEYYKSGQGLSGGKTLKAMGVDTPGRDIVQEALEFADVASALSPDPYTVELVKSFTRMFRAHDLITGSFPEQTLKKLAALGLSTTNFDHIITGDQYSKNNGEAYEFWMSLYPDLAPEQFLYIGDRLRIDSEVPSAMGIRTALVNVKKPDQELEVPQYKDVREMGAVILQAAA